MTGLEKKLTAENADLRAEIGDLKEQLAWLQKQVFGKKSERIIAEDHPTLGLDIDSNSPPEKSKTEVKAHKRSRKGMTYDRFEIPEGLREEKITIDVPEKDRVCKETGEPMVLWKTEESRKLAYKPGEFYVKNFLRPIYKSPLKNSNELVIAPMPGSPIPKSRADVTLLTYILIMKFADHLPLYRIEEIFKRDGINIQRQTLGGWALKMGEVLTPLYELMLEKILQSQRLFTDATTINYLIKGKGSQKGFMYVYSGGENHVQGKSPPYLAYQFAPDGTHKHPEKYLDRFQGLLHSDAHACYDKTSMRWNVSWQPCWAHDRRKFVEAGAGPKKVKDQIIELIRKIFMNERKAWELSREERMTFRQNKQQKLCDELFGIIEEQINGPLLPKDKYSQALKYIYGRKKHFLTFLDNPDAVIDNNLSERFMKPLVIGRKNWLFLGNKDSGKSTAAILSLVQTCRHLDINPQQYLEFVLENILEWNSQKLEHLLPDIWQENQG